MKLPIALNSNQARILFDLLIGFSASLMTVVLSLLSGQAVSAYLLLIPFILLLANWALGIYTRFKVGSGPLKFLILTLSIAASALLFYILAGSPLQPLAWAFLAWFPLIMPRVFLNLNYKTPYAGIIQNALKERGPVLVVGGAGYIGSHTVEQLLLANFKVRVLDSLIYDSNTLDDLKSNPRLEVIQGDATDIVQLVRAMDGASAVVHLAGLVGDPACAVDENFTRHTNVITTRMVKEVAKSFGVPRFVFASSCSVYGVSDTEVDESSSLNPVSLYARTKIDSENELLQNPSENFCVTILRFATVFGHSRRPRFDLVGNFFTAQGMNEGVLTVQGEDQWRPFIHVKDLARAIVTVLTAEKSKIHGEIFNVGDARLNMTIGHLATAVKSIVSDYKPCEIKIMENASDRRNYAVSFKKIKTSLGFEAKTLANEGIREMADNFRKGVYGNYREQKYSNLAMTKKALEVFNDPLHSARLYRPLNDVSFLN
jgi:nucleoside-diphosphate-sugar epimerase